MQVDDIIIVTLCTWCALNLVVSFWMAFDGHRAADAKYFKTIGGMLGAFFMLPTLTLCAFFLLLNDLFTKHLVNFLNTEVPCVRLPDKNQKVSRILKR